MYSPPLRGRGAGATAVLLLLIPCCLLSPAQAAEGPFILRLAPEQVRQGGVAILRIEAAEPLQVVRAWAGPREIPAPAPAGQRRLAVLVGIDLEGSPGDLPIRVEASDALGRSLRQVVALQIVDAQFPVQRLTLPRSFVELDAATRARVQQEQATLSRLWDTVTPDRPWRGAFRMPLEAAPPANGFGVRRIINGEPRAPHTGVDFAVAAGTPVLAPHGGSVALVAEHFFAGRAVILDHGVGLYTMYFHLQQTLAREGQRVAQGETIGRVGSTGRATGPHLHWGARLHGARIDPQALVGLAFPD